MPSWAVGLLVAVAVLAAATVLGVLWQRRNGRFRGPARTGEEGTVSERNPALPADLLTELGVTPGSPATLLQFSSAFCASCRATRRVCAEVATLLDGVHHVEVDAESHLDAVRTLGIMRTPTLLILDGSGREVRRASGAPTKPHVIAALEPLLADAG